MKIIVISLARRLMDTVLIPVIYPAALLLKAARRLGIQNLPRTRSALIRVGVFPIRNHYYEPLFDGRLLREPLDRDRDLPGIDLDEDGQLSFLEKLTYGDELLSTDPTPPGSLEYRFGNGSFDAGDADFLYNVIRDRKPSRIFEIGSGHSTLMAVRAIRKNVEEDPSYTCEHVCVEPYEQPWLSRLDIRLIRQRVEDVDITLFEELMDNDILFIDSSHMIRPQGDVLFEYLELLPRLSQGVLVHIHDIFTPRDYPSKWVTDEVRFWNEQYLLESFLTENPSWRVVAALNFLHHRWPHELQRVCPMVTTANEPGSFYIEKIGQPA